MMTHAHKLLLCLLPAVMLFAACDIAIEDGNLKVRDNGSEIVQIGKGGFKLEGNVTGVTLDGKGLRIDYPNGRLVWGGDGFDIEHVSGSLRVADGRLTVTGKDGKQEVLDTAGNGAEYRTEDGVLVGTGKKAVLPEDYPSDILPLPDGFQLDATALLGSVKVINGHVDALSIEDASTYYESLLDDADSFSREKKAGSVLLRAKVDKTEVTVYLAKSITSDAVNVCVVLGGK